MFNGIFPRDVAGGLSERLHRTLGGVIFIKMSEGLRLMIHDATCRGKLVGLSHVWQAGSGLYRTLGRFDASFGATSWEEALRWAAGHRSDQPIREIQFWGHGKWGRVKIDDDYLSVKSLRDSHPHRPHLDAIRERMGSDSLWWFRTCETFGADAGHRFAQRWADHFDCDVAGHTFIIAFWQSGLHRIGPGQSPGWSPTEGLREGTAEDPERGLWSGAWQPNTVSCLAGKIPAGY